MKIRLPDYWKRLKQWWDDIRYDVPYTQNRESFYTFDQHTPTVGVHLAHRPEIFMTFEDYQRLFTYIRCCPQEISGLGRVGVKEMSNGDLLLSDITLFKQKVTGHDTDLDQEAIGKLVTEIVMNGGEPTDLKLWWHSHHSMSVFWSKGQDEVTIANLKRFGMEYLVSIVGNHAGDYLCRLDIFTPLHVTIDNVPIRIITREDPMLKNRILAEIEDKVDGFHPSLERSTPFTL